MASNYFSISPTAGTGNGTIVVRALSDNNTINDREAIVSINNKSVTIRQYGIPHIQRVGGQEPVSAPATGASYQFKVSTHYAVRFSNKPEWITIDDGQGNTIPNNWEIDPTVANGHTYNFTVLPNTNSTMRETPANFGLYHKIYGSWSNLYDEVSINQAAGSQEQNYIIINDSALDWDSTTAKALNIQTNAGMAGQYTVSINNTSEFELGGSAGNETIRAKAQNSGNSLKTCTVSVASTKAGFSYTATCTVTQYRQPTITLNGSNVVPTTGGTKPVTVTSDYYWWLSPTVSPDTNAYYDYITMAGKTADQNLPPTTGTTYNLTWNSNESPSTRNGNIYVGYLKLDNSTTGRTSNGISFTQENVVSTTLTVSPNRIPASSGEYVSSGGGVYTVTVTTNRTWGLNGTPQFCTVNPTGGTGTTTVTITVPPVPADRTFPRSESITFRTNDGNLLATDTVDVFQDAAYTEPDYVVVDPDEFNLGSGTTYGNTFSVSANSYWYLVLDQEDDWIDTSVTGGTAGYTTGLTFDVAQNTTQTARTGSIKFTTGSPTIYATILVHQNAGAEIPNDYIVVSPRTNNVSSGSSLRNTFTVSASTNWTGSCNANWVALSRTATAGTAGYHTGLTYGVTANTGTTRQATVHFIAGTATTTHTIVQAEAYTPPATYDDLFVEPEDTQATLNNIPATGGIYSFCFENDGANSVDWEINFDDEEWGQFYDGSVPSQSDAVYSIEAGTVGYIFLEVPPTSTGRNNTITFYPNGGDGQLTQHTFNIHQNG